MVYAFVSTVKKRALPAVIAAVGFLAVYLPWVLVPRCTFVYHYFTAVPFLLIALLSAYSRLCGSPRLQNPIFPRTVRGHVGALTSGQSAMLAFLALHLILFAVFTRSSPARSRRRITRTRSEWLPTWFFA